MRSTQLTPPLARSTWSARLLVIAMWLTAWWLVTSSISAWAEASAAPLRVETAIAFAVTAIGAAVAVYLALASLPLLISFRRDRVAPGWAKRWTPSFWRKIVGAAVGGAMGASLATASLATEADEPANPTTVSVSVTSAGWVDTPVSATGQLDEHHFPANLPGDPAQRQETPATPRSAPVTERPHDETVTVRRGDSLWIICANLLPPTATEADIAQAWPILYRENRQIIGDNPSLIYAGQTLDVPAELRS